jgi:hypothetical protein
MENIMIEGKNVIDSIDVNGTMYFLICKESTDHPDGKNSPIYTFSITARSPDTEPVCSYQEIMNRESVEAVGAEKMTEILVERINEKVKAVFTDADESDIFVKFEKYASQIKLAKDVNNRLVVVTPNGKF